MEGCVPIDALLQSCLEVFGNGGRRPQVRLTTLNCKGKAQEKLKHCQSLQEQVGKTSACSVSPVPLADKTSVCISEVIDISPGNLDSSLCFIQPSFDHDVLCI